MPRGWIKLLIDLDGSGATYLAVSLSAGGGALELAVFPSNTSGEPKLYPLLGENGENGLLALLGEKLNIGALSGVVLTGDGIWREVFAVDVLAEIRVTPSGANPNLQATLKIFHDNEYGLTIGGPLVMIPGLDVAIEPQITIYEFGIRYTQATGLKLDAVVDYGEVGGGAPPPAIPENTHEPPKSAAEDRIPLPHARDQSEVVFLPALLGPGSALRHRHGSERPQPDQAGAHGPGK